MNITIPTLGSRGDVQPYVALGVGPGPIPQKHLTADTLAAAIQTAISDQTMQTRAAELGRRIGAEQGIVNAVEVVNQVMQPRAAAAD